MTIVFLHGFTGHPQSFEPVARHLPKSARVVCESIFGHRGQDEQGTGILTFEDEVDRLASSLSSIANEGLCLLGYSLGARLALGLLTRHGALASRAILIGLNPGLASEAERAGRRASDERWAQLLERSGIQSFVEAWEEQPIFDSQQTLPKETLALQRALRLGHHPIGLARALRILGLGSMPDMTDSLAGLHVPVTLVHGDRDSKFAAISARMGAPLSNARQVTIEGAGHNPLLERPAGVAALLTQEGAMDAER